MDSPLAAVLEKQCRDGLPMSSIVIIHCEKSDGHDGPHAYLLEWEPPE